MNTFQRIRMKLLVWLANWTLNQLRVEPFADDEKPKNGHTHFTVTDEFIEERDSAGTLIRLYVRTGMGYRYLAETPREEVLAKARKLREALEVINYQKNR